MKNIKLIILSIIMILCCIACGGPPYNGNGGGDAICNKFDDGINRQLNPSPISSNTASE